MSTTTTADRLRGVARPFARRRWLSRRRPGFESLAIIPPDLRTTDVGFMDEVLSGLFGVNGVVIAMVDDHPFACADAPLAWQQGVHGFGWLRHLDAVGTRDAEDLARHLVDQWLQHPQHPRDVRCAPDVIARRVLSWLAHAGLILDSESRVRYDRVAAALDADLHQLDRVWRKAQPGEARLIAAIARVQGLLSRGALELTRRRAERDLVRELDLQVRADGSHVSRDTTVLVRLMLDLLPLRQCYQAREIPVPAGLFSAMRRIVPFLRFMRHYNGVLANFNGDGAVSADELATVVGFDAALAAPPRIAPDSGYVRLSAGDTLVIADIGAPPPAMFVAASSASCLSFELSVGGSCILSNPTHVGLEPLGRGADGGDAVLRPPLRIDDQSAAAQVAQGARGRVLQMMGAVAVAPPPQDGSDFNPDLGAGFGLSFAAVQSGFARRFGINHTRHLSLATDGARVEGADRLTRVTRFEPKRHLFSVHFYIDPTVTVRRGETAGEVVLTLRDGAIWVFQADPALLAIEPVTGHGRTKRLQIVLRGVVTQDDALLAIHWAIVRRDAVQHSDVSDAEDSAAAS
jgi:uncharacterized heparinase superfamily protein